MDAERRILNSALWAAYGDALGFITELADEQQVRHRLREKSAHVTSTRPWARRIGGQFGATIELPAGCYSDDTQLRLATSRAIRGTGEFDVEAFAKVELPVWLAYQLGGGRGTKAAATALTRRGTSWFSNFYQKPSRYLDAGGNGAAMRIQPHVWAAKDLRRSETFLHDVIRNSVTTHGHPRGFTGAALHALLLAAALEQGSVPGPDQWDELVSQLESIAGFIKEDEELNTFWLPAWEDTSGTRIEIAIASVIHECRSDIEIIRSASTWDEWNYSHLVHRIGGFTAEHRGSGTKTVLLALALAWQFRREPERALIEAANCLGSDTDSIATLTGAILGATQANLAPGLVADEAYIRTEAARMFSVSRGEGTSFVYPNLLKWTPPASPTGVVGLLNGRIAVSGLGFAREDSDSVAGRGPAAGNWKWYKLEFGQRILARVREPLPPLRSIVVPGLSAPGASSVSMPQADLFSEGGASEPKASSIFQDHNRNAAGDRRENRWVPPAQIGLDQATDLVVNSGFDPHLIGELLLHFTNRTQGVEMAIAFAAVVAKARIARVKRASGSAMPSSPNRNPPPPASTLSRTSPNPIDRDSAKPDS